MTTALSHPIADSHTSHMYDSIVQHRLNSISLTGYECLHPNTSIKTFDLTHVKGCNITHDNLSYIDKPIQLIEIKRTQHVPMIACKIEVFATLFECGMFSHISLVRQSFFNSYIYLSEKECSRLNSQDEVSLFGREFKQLHSKVSNARYFSVGVEKDGSCVSGHEIDIDGKTFSDVAGTVSLKIEYSSFTGTKGENDKFITFLNGHQCMFGDMSCVLPAVGTIYWNIIQDTECLRAKYHLLYEGPSKKLLANENEYGVYMVEDHDILFSLKTKSEVTLCGYYGYTTEHPDLMIIESDVRDRMQIESSKLDKSHTGNIVTYMNTKMVYIERLMTDNLNDLYVDLLTKQCDLEYKLLMNHLSDALVNPNGFAHFVTKSEGSMGVLAGEAIHVIQCVPIPVYIRESDRCYQELPIIYGNNTKGYLSPINHLISDIGSEVTCTENMVTSFKYNDHWYRVGDKTHIITPPYTLVPNVKKTWEAHNSKNLVIGGLYSKEVMEDTIKMIYFGRNRGSMANTAVRMGYDPNADRQHYTMLHTLKDEDVKSLFSRYYQSLTSFTDLLGHYVSVGLGLWLIYSVVMWVINTVIRGLSLYKLGGSPKDIIMAVQPAWAQYIMAVKLQDKKGSKDDQVANEDKDDVQSLEKPPRITGFSPIYPSLK